MRNIFLKTRTTFEYFLDLFFPRFCLGCGREGTFVCPACQAQLACASPLLTLYPPPLETVYIAFNYTDKKIIAALIKRIKYRFTSSLIPVLAEATVEHVFSEIPWDQIEYLVPVPSSNVRKKERGFNHIEIFSNQLSALLQIQGYKIPTLTLLRKIRHTAPQATLTRKERLTNLKDAFAINQLMQMGKMPRTACVVDDVYTTGTTLCECARVLKENGVERVFGLVIAKKYHS